jgi:hypothetical protein
MTSRLFGAGLLLLFAGSLGVLAAPNGATQTWMGYVTDTYCGYNRVKKPPTAVCTFKCVQEQHAKYAFFNFADKKVYVLNPQSEAAKFAGQTVMVKGTLAGHEAFATSNGEGAGEIIAASSIKLESSK